MYRNQQHLREVNERHKMFNGNHNKQANEKEQNTEILKFRQFKKIGDTTPLKKTCSSLFIKGFCCFLNG